MRSLIILSFLFVSFLSYGESFFQNKMKWIVEYFGSSIPEGIYSQKVVYLDGEALINGYHAVKMFIMNDNDESSKVFISYIREENGKVWFWHEYTNKWYLMYDFTLNIGEGNYIYAIPLKNDNSIPFCSYTKCVNSESNIDDHELCLLSLEEYESENSDILLGTGNWIKGIGSTRGVLENIGFDTDGIGSSLIEASIGDSVIYKATHIGLNTLDSKPLDIQINNNQLTIPNINTKGILSIYSIDGKLITEKLINNSELKITLPQKGVYLIYFGNYCQKIYIQ